MPKITVAGHSAHVIVNDWPIALLTTSFAFDCIYAATKKPEFAKAAHLSLVAGLAMGTITGATGAAEYTAVEKKGSTGRYARVHAALGIGIMVASGINYLARRKAEPQYSRVSLFASGLASAMTVLTAWYGDEMVFGDRVRVNDQGIKPDAMDLRLPGDEMVTDALRLEAAS